MITMNAIQWPKKWILGETDNFVSNEVIVKGLDFNKVVQHLPFLFKAQELYSQAEKSGLGELDMAAVYHYLEKGEH
ncbi:hypothetical protein [Helicobacter pylori]|jgi:hypothetical protein|uniref:Uncharacterized protein n=3 Tax=Helicobacter pylori TaxID=210 RepID=O25358_HELPY|nr:hypothetical protein [Helicobacter pylori]AAD07716.1 predicted coding region HP0641 [Helicobacter pylori 26695]AJF08923.1 hypothetical protein SE87_03305 [Helicobacter pylori 26695-1]AJF10463.1 hypothetical protein SE88_03305 [Helicobacter pylori]AUV74837.1 hypothetical protein C2841_03315 [Helicobacter pylori]AUV76333.1 hypothetical protein C2843_03320 [Helicobacter pylori]